MKDEAKKIRKQGCFLIPHTSSLRIPTEEFGLRAALASSAIWVKDCGSLRAISESILRFLSVRIDEEVKHGLKVARNTKPRRPRPEVSDAPYSSPTPTTPPAEPAGDFRGE